MDEAKQQYYVLKGVISEMPEEERNKIREAEEQFRRILAETGDAGGIAFAMLAMEIAQSS